MGNLWFMDPFVLRESFLLFKLLCKERGYEGLREGHTRQWAPHTGAYCAHRVVPAPQLESPGNWGHLVTLALVIAQTSVSMSLFRATTVSLKIFLSSESVPIQKTGQGAGPTMTSAYPAGGLLPWSFH